MCYEYLRLYKNDSDEIMTIYAPEWEGTGQRKLPAEGDGIVGSFGIPEGKLIDLHLQGEEVIF